MNGEKEERMDDTSGEADPVETKPKTEETKPEVEPSETSWTCDCLSDVNIFLYYSKLAML